MGLETPVFPEDPARCDKQKEEIEQSVSDESFQSVTDQSEMHDL